MGTASSSWPVAGESSDATLQQPRDIVRRPNHHQPSTLQNRVTLQIQPEGRLMYRPFTLER
jgi:hypothetical protein